MKKSNYRWRHGNADLLETRFVYIRLWIVLLVLACNSFAQPPTLTQNQIDWNAESARITLQISTGTIEQKREALFQIRNLQTEQASRLAVPALTDSNEIVRATAVSSVVFLPENEAADLLLPLLKDKAEFVRRETAYALGKVGNSKAVGSLLQTLQKDKVLEVRNASAIALGMIGNVSAVEPLTLILSKRPNEDEEFLRRSAARSVGQIAQIIRSGKTRVLTPQNFLPKEFKELGQVSNPVISEQFPVFNAAVIVLTRVLIDSREANDTRREAAFSLGAIGDSSTISTLQSYVNSGDPYLAEISREALLKVKKSQ